MIRTKQLLLTCCLLALCCSVAIGQKIEQETRVLENASQAVERALTFTGFKISKDYSLPHVAEEIAELDTVEQSIFPFLADQINGKEVWRIELDSILLRQDTTATGQELDYYKDFIITMDAASGKLIEIRSKVDFLRETPVEPTAFAAEGQIRRGERYVGLPENSPQVKLSDLLVDCHQARFVCMAPRASLIVARYVMHLHTGRMETTAKPVWSIDLYGVAVPKGGTHCRTVIDANTGAGIVTRSERVAPGSSGEEDTKD